MKKSFALGKFEAFTLIELLVVVTISVIFFGISLAQYNNFTEQAKLKNEARKLIDVIELAKKKALSSDLQDKNCSNFGGYQLTLDTSDYSLFFCCNSSCVTNTNVYKFSKNISITVGIGNLNFPPLMKGLNITIPSIQLKNSMINKCIVISISPIGVIELAGSIISC